MYTGCLPICHMYLTMSIHVYILYSIYYQFSPYFSYKLYLNTVYKYSITIPIYMLPILYYLKMVKIHVFKVFRMGFFTI